MSIAHKISKRNRDQKWSIFTREFSLNKNLKVLDVGFSEFEYSESDNYIEKHYPFPKNLSALSIDTPQKIKQKYPKVNFFKYDGNKFPFTDKDFDICWSNAVIEHVGDIDEQINFIKEISRVSKRAFVTTPNKYFPVEVHTLTPLIHFLPKKLFDIYLTIIGKKWATGSYMNLLSENKIKKILNKAGITHFKIFSNKAIGFTLDFVIIFEE